MPNKVEHLQRRRDTLVREAAQQREDLIKEYHQLDRPLRMADTAISLYLNVRRNPWLISLATAVIGAIGFRSKIGPGKLIALWKGTRGAFKLWQRFRG